MKPQLILTHTYIGITQSCRRPQLRTCLNLSTSAQVEYVGDWRSRRQTRNIPNVCRLSWWKSRRMFANCPQKFLCHVVRVEDSGMDSHWVVWKEYANTVQGDYVHPQVDSYFLDQWIPIVKLHTINALIREVRYFLLRHLDPRRQSMYVGCLSLPTATLAALAAH